MANSDDAAGPLSVLAERWWMMLVRGAAAVLAGVIAIALPEVSLLALVFLFAVYALVDGVFALLHAVRKRSNWGWLLAEGIAGIGAGVIAFVWPAITLLALMALVATWAILTGIAEIGAAIRLRRMIRNEWLLAGSGVLSIAFAVLLIVFPAAGAVALAWMIGFYALLFGVLLIALGLRLHGLRSGPLPRPRAPTPA